MSGALRSLGVTPDRWERLHTGSVWAGAALVVVAWLLMALNRLGGLAFDEPRALTRLTLYGVWGWLGLAVAMWAIARRFPRGAVVGGSRRSPADDLVLMLAVVGVAHAPIVALAILVFIAAGALQLLGPGLLGAIVVFVVLVPAALVTGVQHVFGLGVARAATAVAAPYGIWSFVVLRHLLGQVWHLL